eukprot:TRINITY_DN8036_c0_g1_i1.p1 TRINITY_DN8036_c0_g1~~TRINITY_DN8036_c0_g1_i1.p1  ORF type:complete len:515 (+),score=131.51 TRINITY_DN8036_c0_g1_i1:78-1622(+)
MYNYFSSYSSRYSKREESSEEESDNEEESTPLSMNKLQNPALVSRRGSMKERAKYIPLRLTHKERQRLRILESTLTVSQYTDQVDIHGDLTDKGKKQQLKTQLRSINAVLSGILLSVDYEEGQKLLSEKDFSSYSKFFQNTFEVGRRYKITNPDKMRSEYGKLIYLLQDASSSVVSDQLGFNIVCGIKTVYSYYEAMGCLEILDDDNIWLATKEIIHLPGKSKHETQLECKRKEKVVKELCKKYSSSTAKKDDILYGMYSLTDNNSFLNSNAEPIYKMLELLKKYFKPNHIESPEYDLSIVAGVKGARLDHSHENQYNYVLQSLTLWADIMDNMFMLWYLAENDLLSKENEYQLKDTGQGFHRVQQSPQVARAMQAILDSVKTRVNTWVGSSVIHLGDHNVPNSLMFIDKYTQIPRILVPIVHAIEQIDEIINNKATNVFIDKAFGGPEKAKKDILVDFFRYGFDGSGADNFIDAGSCIDGRLTSAWNWCSQLEKKPFFPIFLLTGFTGFDGNF